VNDSTDTASVQGGDPVLGEVLSRAPYRYLRLALDQGKRAHSVYAYLLLAAGHARGPRVAVSTQQIADATGVLQPNVVVALNRLVRAGMIQRDRTRFCGRAAASYTLAMHAVWCRTLARDNMRRMPELPPYLHRTKGEHIGTLPAESAFLCDVGKSYLALTSRLGVAGIRVYLEERYQSRLMTEAHDHHRNPNILKRVGGPLCLVRGRAEMGEAGCRVRVKRLPNGEIAPLPKAE
jgi:hypothetical protein